MDEAFARLRSYARSNGRGLTGTADALVSGTLSVTVVEPSPAPTPSATATPGTGSTPKPTPSE
jgi:hypothetical protein